MNHPEQEEQIALFEWAEVMTGRFPELSLLFHIPNGGKRSKAEACIFKAMGVKSGVPDLFLPVSRSHYHGLFIEMKAGKGKASDFQSKWLNDLSKQGYASAVCFGWQEAAETIKQYLQLNANNLRKDNKNGNS